MKNRALVGILALISMVGSAMAADRVPDDKALNKANCPVQSISTENYKAILTPVRDQVGNEWMAFNLEINNKTDKELVIDWNDTYYLRHGKIAGKFAFGGQQLGRNDKDASKQPDIVPPNGTFSKVIWPESRFYFSGPNQGWFNMPMAAGEQGVYLSVRTAEQQETRNRIVLNLQGQEKLCSLSNSTLR